MPKPPSRTAEEIAEGMAELDDSQDFHDRVSVGESRISPGEALDHEAAQERDIEELDVLDGLRALQTGDPIRWRIYRVDSDDPQRLGYLAEWSTAQLTQQRLLDKFGGGTYRIKGSFSNGKYAAQRTIVIAHDGERRAVAGSSDVAGGGTPFSLSEFMAAQEAREQARRREEDERRERERAEKREQEERSEKRLLALATILAPIGSALVTSIFAPRQDTTAALITALKPPDPMQQLAALKALMPEQRQGPDVIDRAMKLVEAFGGNKGGGEGVTGWMDVLKEIVVAAGPSVGKVIEGAVQSAAAAAAARQQTAEAPSAVRSTAPAALSAPSLMGSDNGSAATADSSGAVVAPGNVRFDTGDPDMNLKMLAMLPWMQKQLEAMLVKAAAKKDPALYAKIFVDDFPENQDPYALLGLLQDPNWFQALKSFDARVANFERWFTQCRKYILEECARLQAEARAGAAPPAAPAQSPSAPAQPTAPVEIKPPSLDGK